MAAHAAGAHAHLRIEKNARNIHSYPGNEITMGYNYWKLSSESPVDSLCRDGTDTTRIFSLIEWLRTPKHGSYKSF